MTLHDLCTLYASSPAADALLSAARSARPSMSVSLGGLCASATPLLFASVAERMGSRPVVFVMRDGDEAGYFYQDLSSLMGAGQALCFPSGFRRKAKYGQRDAAGEMMRTEVLSAVGSLREAASTRHALYIVTYPEALAELVARENVVEARRMTLCVGQHIGVGQVAASLRELGFRETDYVYEPGQYARRGGIIDVFSYTSEHPYRIDFFGNEIDTLRTFDVESQLSLERQEGITVMPSLAETECERVPLLEYMPKDTLVVVRDGQALHDVVARVWDEGFSAEALADRTAGATEAERAEIQRQLRAEAALCTPSRLDSDMAGMAVMTLTASDDAQADVKAGFHIDPQPLFHKNFDLLGQTLAHYTERGYRVYILASSEKQRQRLADILAEREGGAPGGSPHPTPLFVAGTLHEGFTDHTLRLCCLTDHQIFDRFHKYTLRQEHAREGKAAMTLRELQTLEVGDYIVHIDFGIGRFGGLMRVPVGEKWQEVVRIIYQNNDKVDLSIHALYKISRYRRSETGEPPRLSTLGTGAWERIKERAKKRIKDIARDLIRLYARRRAERGFAFSPDNYMQHELEASFLYEDTPDQLRTTAEVKADMERAEPMDRLVCGDVGFGKTEVAIRAAFKAACDGKQVAVLVPTTVLAFQHYRTFRERLRNFPVRVEYLSRARSAADTRRVAADLAAGRVDILVGTHKLIGKSIHWHDLGLLIIDEEQKFGVATKERLRTLKTNVDTLTLSATPIPRTLQFSLMGARDMSVMRTPPPNRHPIRTCLTTFSHEVLAEAIGFEMSRDGQVFVVCPRITQLEDVRRLIMQYVPDCRVATGHGQMKPEELEEVVMGFVNYDYDVLLSTTIVENGVDIANANTIIICDAHRFGLSDLHQMRGRVGRSNRKAFCYLLSPPLALLPAEARRRLEALETFSSLGSGFNIAMQDLDIRGAGSMLGAEQSGFMEDLGYETYQKILTQAVAELKRDEFAEVYRDTSTHSSLNTPHSSLLTPHSSPVYVDDCTVESDLAMYFPDNYVPGSAERIRLYRELDSIEDDATLQAYRERLCDRFGPVPEEGEELMRVVQLRRLGRRLGCERIVMRGGQMTLQLVSAAESGYYQSPAFGSLLSYIGRNPQRCTLNEVRGRRLVHVSRIDSAGAAVEVLGKVLEQGE